MELSSGWPRRFVSGTVTADSGRDHFSFGFGKRRVVLNNFWFTVVISCQRMARTFLLVEGCCLALNLSHLLLARWRVYLVFQGKEGGGHKEGDGTREKCRELVVFVSFSLLWQFIRRKGLIWFPRGYSSGSLNTHDGNIYRGELYLTVAEKQRENERKGIRSQYPLQRDPPKTQLPPIRSHLLKVSASFNSITGWWPSF